MKDLLRVCLGVLLMAAVAAYAAAVIRDYSRYAPHYPYIAVDDGLANVAYSLATQGRYGYLASPVQGFTDFMRDRGFFNYGPWYFYAGAALIWLFGYSLAIVRAMHPAAILAIAAVACWWFGRRGQMAAGALVALGLIHSLALGQWPMARPDIAVSVFATIFIVAAGLAIEKRSARWWFLAGVGAGCAALSHLIAWALVPCALLTLAIALAGGPPEDRRRARAVSFVAAVALGFAAATLMFYASFGFRVRDHLSTLAAYSGYLGGSAGADNGHRRVLSEHLRLAFWYLSLPTRVALGASVAGGLAWIARTWTLPREARQEVLAVALPPIAVVLCYGLSLATYASHHTGYAILLQVATWWCAGAVVCVTLHQLAHRLPASRRVVEALLALVLISASVRLVSAEASNPRLALVRSWVGIQAYLDRIAELIPQGATVWGTAMNGIDSPGRFELVELVDGANIVQRSRTTHVVDSSGIAPEYLVWDYPLNRVNLVQTLHPRVLPKNQRKPAFGHTIDLLGSVRYRIIALVAAPPYGVTRVYERMLPGHDAPARVPAVNAFDVATQSWRERLEGPLAADFHAAPGVLFNIDYAPAEAVRADRSVVADLPAGAFLLHVRVGRSSGSSRGTIVSVTAAPSITEAIGELGPSVDVSPYAEGDDEVYLIREHAGGPLYVSQFDNGRDAGIDGVDVYRIQPRLHDDQLAERLRFNAMPPLASWVPPAPSGIRASLTASGALAIEGDATRMGYQIVSPSVPSQGGATVTFRAAFTAEQGAVCVGALNGTAAKWLANGGNPARDFSFAVDDTGAFRAVFYNCNAKETENAPSRFTVSNVRYAIEHRGLYVDRLLSVRNPSAAEASIVTDPRVRAFPAGLAVPSDALADQSMPVRHADMSFRAPIVEMSGSGWTIKGKAAGAFSYLLRSKSQHIDDDRRVLVAQVRVLEGGVTVGLLKGDQWAGKVDLTSPGEYLAVVDPPGAGEYDVVIANNLTNPSLATNVIVSRLGWARR